MQIWVTVYQSLADSVKAIEYNDNAVNIRRNLIGSALSTSSLNLSSNFDRDQELYKSFKKTLMEELCTKYKDFSRNKGIYDPLFRIEDIRKKRNEGGFGILGLGDSLLEEMLRRFEQEYHYIMLQSEDRTFSLTEKGKQFCNSDWEDSEKISASSLASWQP